MKKLPGVTRGTSQRWTCGDAQSGGEGCSMQGEQCVKRHRGEKGWASWFDPGLAGPQLPGRTLELYPKGPKQRKGMEGTKEELGAS